MFFSFTVHDKKRKYITGCIGNGSRISRLYIDSKTQHLARHDVIHAYGSYDPNGDGRTLTVLFIFDSEEAMERAAKFNNRMRALSSQAIKAMASTSMCISQSEAYLANEYNEHKSYIDYVIKNEGWLSENDVSSLKDYATFWKTISAPAASELERLESFAKNGLKFGVMAFSRSLDSVDRLFSRSFNVCIRGKYYRLSGTRSVMHEPAKNGLHWGDYLDGKVGQSVIVYSFDLLDSAPKDFEMNYLNDIFVPQSSVVLI